MPFTELQPPPRAASGTGTGVRISVTQRYGVRVSLSGAALATLDAGPAFKLRVYIDRDPALPRLRVVADPAGGFTLRKPPKGEWMWFALGALPGLGGEDLKGLDCTFDAEPRQLDIDLPRELRATSVHQPAGQPSTSTGPRPRPVTLPGRQRETV